MRLSVSNIAWDEPEQDRVYEVLRAHDVAGVEVAPTKLWPEWEGATPEAASAAREEIRRAGFEVPALQSILYARPELQVFASDEVHEAAFAHLASVAALARELGARVLVFGSPKNRTRGALPLPEAMERGATFFRGAGEACAPFGVDLCIEPNPEVYQCDFMSHWQEAWEMVQRVDHPNVGIHLDAACIRLAGDDPAEAVRSCGTAIRHFHVTEPELGDFSAPTIDHARIAEALAETGYRRWLSIEMRRGDDPPRAVEEAVTRVREWYGRVGP